MRSFSVRVSVPGLLGLLGCVLSSCAEYDENASVTADRESAIPIKVYVDDPVRMNSTKSSFSKNDIDRITDLNIFVYHDGRLLQGYGGYYEDVSDAMLAFPPGVDQMDIYMLGNTGKVSAPVNEAELDRMRYVVKDYGEFRDRGVPVAGVFTCFRRGTLAEFPLKRLVGQFDVRMAVSAHEADYVIKDIRIMNCVRDVYPFSSDRKAVLFTQSGQYADSASGDMLTQSDIDDLNSGKPVSLYFLENLQGVLLPANTDPKKKIPSSLPSGAPDRCTYVEITADVTTSAARYTDCRYRFYPGSNETTDFSIVRNTLYEVVLDFTQNMICEQEWRIEADEPEVVGIQMNKDEAMVIKGGDDMIFIQAYDNNGDLMDFDVEMLSSSGKLNVEKVMTYYLDEFDYGDAIGLRFTSNVEFCDLCPYGSEPAYDTETVRISSKETYNGKPIYNKDINVRIYDKPFPLLIKLAKRSGENTYRVTLRGHNPMKRKISVSAQYSYSGKTASVEEKTVTDISEMPVYLGALESDVTPQNLSRIDFVVKVDGVPLEFGEDCRAVYGPDENMYPALFDHYPDDGGLLIIYTDDEISGAPLQQGMSKDVLEVEFTEPGNVGHLGKGLYFSNRVFIHYPDNDRYKPFRVRGVNSRPVGGAMFYFMNGCLESYRVYATRGAMVKYPDKAWTGATAYYWGPGRDLFSENASGNVIDPTHKMGFWITEWTNLLGKYKSTQESRYYSGQLYMTINNCSCWPGGDSSEYGSFPEIY